MGLKFDVQSVIKYAAYETSRNGYVKRADDEDNCTANKLFDLLIKNELSDEQLSSVKDRVSKWFAYINSQDGDYFKEVKLEIAKPKIDEVKLGLVASSFASFDKHMSFVALNEIEKASEYLGEEGDSVAFCIRDFKMIKSGTSKFKNGDSKWYLYKIHDVNGNSITLFANENMDTEFKSHKQIEATVQKLSEYNGVKQTQISKVRFV